MWAKDCTYLIIFLSIQICLTSIETVRSVVVFETTEQLKSAVEKKEREGDAKTQRKEGKKFRPSLSVNEGKMCGSDKDR